MAALPPDQANMDAYMEHVLGIEDDVMREKLRDAGFRNLETLVRKKDTFAHKVCQMVRKSTGGLAEEKDVPIINEEQLEKLVKLTRLLYMVQRPLEYDLADPDTLDVVGAWYDEIDRNKDKSTPPAVFSDSLNKKEWFEAILEHLRVTPGEAGVPLYYVAREVVTLPFVDPGFGNPSLDEEVATRGRHNGHYWRADNKQLWTLVKGLTQGTNAWRLSRVLPLATMEEVPSWHCLKPTWKMMSRGF